MLNEDVKIVPGFSLDRLTTLMGGRQNIIQHTCLSMYKRL